MPYSHTTWLQLRTALAARLHDPSLLYYVTLELDAYLTEALRTFSALSAFWRERGTFNTVAATAFYDLPTQLSTLLSYSVTDRNLVNIMQYHLMETPNVWTVSTTWGGTAQFLMADLVNSIERRRNQFLADTGMVVTHSTVAQPAPPIGRVPLADTVIDVRRLCWSDVDANLYHLWREDEFALNAYDPSWALDASRPTSYSVMGPPPLTVQIAPIPLDIGTLDMLAVHTGAALTVTTGVILGIPDDYCWAVKWGALADILGKDGPAYDPERAKFAESRYQQGVALARAASCVVQAQLQGVNLFVDSLHNTDAMYTDWQNDAASTPTDLAIAAYNLIAVRPIPDGVYSVSFDVVKKAPIPATDATQVQLGREQLDMILDYAEHLALFKVGGEEFNATQRQADNFVKQALSYNNRLAASAKFAVHAALHSSRESIDRPREVRASALGALKGGSE